MKSCIYEGTVTHHRIGPPEHRFRYNLAFLYLDLGELDVVFRNRLLWSVRRPAVVWFRRADHLGPPDQPLDESVRDLVEAEKGNRPTGAIRLLTHPRYFGWAMSPVSFYFCFDSSENLDYVIAEVNNTPWGEQHCYVLDRTQFVTRSQLEAVPKRFHVSPFMPMDMQYVWRTSAPQALLQVQIENWRKQTAQFRAQMVLRRQTLNGWTLAKTFVRYPLMTQKVFLAIYWQAVRLWWKGCRFFPHPKMAHRRTVDCEVVSR